MSEYHDSYHTQVRIPKEASKNRKVDVKIDVESSWRIVGESDVDLENVTYDEKCNMVKWLLERDKGFKELFVNSTPTVYAVVELFKNRIVVKLLSDTVVKYPLNDQLTSRGYDPDRYVFIRIANHHNTFTVIKGDNRLQLIDLFCDVVVDRHVPTSRLQLAICHAKLQDY